MVSENMSYPMAVSLVFTMTYCLVFPLAIGGYLRKKFDPDLFNADHWQSVENFFPYYSYRRAMMYAICASWRPLSRRRFAGYDFQKHLGTLALLGCRLYLILMITMTLIALLYSL